MVQVFGNRILGGIGAPGGGMSEAFGAGVNTALNQRVSRQAMVGEGQRQSILAQEQAFRIEDRADAKKRQAAAAAAAAANRARAMATSAAVAAAGGGTGAGLYFDPNASRTPGVVARPSSTIPLALGVRAGAASGTVSGGGGTAALGGGAGSDTLGVAGPSFETRGRGQTGVAASPATLGQMSSARPGDYQSRAGIIDRVGIRSADDPRPTFERVVLPGGSGPAGEFLYNRATGEVRMPDGSVITNPGYAETVSNKAKATVQAGAGQDLAEAERLTAQAKMAMEQGYTTLATDLADRARQYRARAEATAQQEAQGGLRARMMDRGVLAEEGAGSSAAAIRAGEAAARAAAVQGPNRPPPLPLEGPGFEAVGRGVPPTAAPPMQTPVPPSPELGFGGVAPLEAPLAGGTSFGPKLGAVATPTEMFYADMGYTPAGQLDLQAIMDKQELIQDPAFSQIAEQQRVSYIYAAEDALARGDTAGYIEAQKQIKTQEMLILAQQVVAGGNEATNFDSTKRLSLAASMIEGVDIVLVPKGDGNADVYVNGQLDDANIPIQSIVDQLRARVDSAYIEQMSAAAQEQQASNLRVDEALRIAEGTSYLDMTEAQFGAELARETAELGEISKVTADVLRERLVRKGVLPMDETITITKTDAGGLIVTDSMGNPIVQYVPNPNGDGSLVARRE